MKFGDTLHQRSIPEWSINNVDYNDLKHLIKVHTSNDPSHPQIIPAGDNEVKAAQQFEQELYVELERQHERVNEFVQVKAGELSRRLVDLDKHIARLEDECSSHKGLGLLASRAQKFARLDSIIHRAGNDIQSLSRFAKANALAFYKLLKKYRKWTGSRALEERFRRNVLDHPSSFSKRSFESLFAQYANSLDALRTTYALASDRQPAGTTQRLPSGSLPNDGVPKQTVPKQTSSAEKLQVVSGAGSPLDWDTAFAITPLGKGAVRATYWVHPDNLMNVQILLTRYTSQHKNHELAVSTTSPTSPSSSPRSSAGDPTFLSYGREKSDEIGNIICDDLRQFAKRRSSETVEDMETAPGLAGEKATATIRFSRIPDTTIAVDTAVNCMSPKLGHVHHFVTANLSKKDIRRLFDISNEDQILDKKSTPKNAEDVVRWLAAHREVRPLVKVQCRRFRFLGLENSGKGGVWVTLDTNIHMRQCSPEQIAADKSLLGIDVDTHQSFLHFPHAVLEVRVEGNGSVALIRALDVSHSAERVRGFSLEIHAVAAVCKPHGMPRPFWMSALAQDIRKLPPLCARPGGRVPNNESNLEQASTRHTSLSASSTRNGLSSSGFSRLRGDSSATSAPDMAEASPVSPLKKKRRRSKRQHRSRRLRNTAIQPRQQRYWNEFDDGSEGGQNEAYAIYIDPNAPSGIPDGAAMSKLYHSFAKKVQAATDEVASWLRSSKARDLERNPITDRFHSSPDDSDLSDDQTPVVSQMPRRYLTFPSQHRHPRDRARERLLLQLGVTSFGASLVLLFIASILFNTKRKKVATKVDLGVVTVVTVSLVSAIVGMGSLMARRASLDWFRRTAILLVLLCILLVSLALLVAVSHPVR
ncbi:MAG: hypothetical protein Q9217_000377 [Psora testacea]